jgi:hypothetical protein
MSLSTLSVSQPSRPSARAAASWPSSVQQLEQRRCPVLFNDELGEVLPVAGQRGEVGGGVGARGRGARVETRDVVPYEEEDGLVLGDTVRG